MKEFAVGDWCRNPPQDKQEITDILEDVSKALVGLHDDGGSRDVIKYRIWRYMNAGDKA